MCFFSPPIEVPGAHNLPQVFVIVLLLLFNAFMLFENAMLINLSVCSPLLFMYFVLTFVFLWLVSCFLCLLVCLFVCLFVCLYLFVCLLDVSLNSCAIEYLQRYFCMLQIKMAEDVSKIQHCMFQ